MYQDVVSDGPLTVRRTTARGHCFVALSGELDRANVALVERMLERSLQDARPGLVLVSLRDLRFIDSAGIAVLVRAMADDHPVKHLGFLPSRSFAVRRTLTLTGVSDKMFG
jgi:anti-anti-sigma factor